MIASGHRPALVMATQVDFNDVPRVRPIGVVILLFGYCPDFGHELKCVSKIGKFKFAIQRIIFFDPTQGHGLLVCHLSGA